MQDPSYRADLDLVAVGQMEICRLLHLLAQR